MIKLRTLVAAAAALAFTAQAAPAQDWKAKYPELVFGKIPDENASGTTTRWTPLTDYLTKQLGVPVKLRIANDYAAVIEGQRAGNIQIAMYGPASYARAYLVGAKVEPFAIEVNGDGTKGYHSVLYVKKDSPYQKIEDLKGKNLCLVDPNSTSGNNVPRFMMNKMSIDPDKFFAKVIYAGSHENAVIGVAQGTCDAAFNWWNNEDESNLKRMDRKGMAKEADFRIILKSDLIVNSPMAYLSDLPDDLKAAIRKAVLDLATNDPETFNKIYEGKAKPYAATSHKDYEPVVELIKFVDTLRKHKS
ncbi:phosphonate ABC transporter substrate-binding protein [Rhodopseudomonas palustris]|uniref:Phosphonate ABC transporter substrate-binding protein n=1 Tax=Rhodopseudomonas palustris TaxID=1076 RepID=A0A323UK17_RHOPL|nr:phosphonate ABC transporter substrate-binding protein [Rhodopseudomonas palustris]PZA11286.1 phosphonate ABC transporter substrate-binding protein [Rhodopseudomonas palustris]